MAKGKRRANREGSVWQRRDGRWTGAAYVLTTAGTFKRTYVYAHTDEAHAKLVRLQESSARGIPLPDHPWKVGEYLDYWLANVARPAVRPTTYAKYELIVRLYLRPGLGPHRLDRLSVQVVQSFFNARLVAGDSVALVHITRTVLSTALACAMREELLQRNLARLTPSRRQLLTGANPGRLTKRGVFSRRPGRIRCTRRLCCCWYMAFAAVRFSG